MKIKTYEVAINLSRFLFHIRFFLGFGLTQIDVGLDSGPHSQNLHRL